jgi:glycosyltransferase involved in cell wall biosynthesis
VDAPFHPQIWDTITAIPNGPKVIDFAGTHSQLMSSAMQPLISVIIPNYNHTRFVGDAIQSVLDQTYRCFEIIVVDDGSTDDCKSVVGRFSSQVRYIRQENQGLGGARNTGIRAAKGDFIGLLDADDQWQPQYLETMVNLIYQNPDAAVYYCSAQGTDIQGNDLPQVFGSLRVAPENLYQSLTRANFLIPSTIIMRRAVLIEAGLFDASLKSCEDWDMWLRIAPQCGFVGTEASLVRYRIHGSSLSANPVGMQHATRVVVEKHFGLDDGKWDSWSAEKRRAFGGLYRYYLLSSIQRQNDWQSGSKYLRLALQADPTLATDLDLFYDLALGSQPVGYRGSSLHLNLNENAARLDQLLLSTFQSPHAKELNPVRRQSYGTAFFAMGLAFYNTGDRSASRRFLSRAVFHYPSLGSDPRIFGNIARSFLSQSMVKRLKKFRR